MKFYKFLITAACIAIAAVCIALIVRVNRAFPNAEEVSYTKDNPADLDGLEITPVNAKVYTLEDYSKISGQYKNCLLYTSIQGGFIGYQYGAYGWISDCRADCKK